MSSRVTVDPEKMGGAPCIRDLRIPVATIADMAARELGAAKILELYPDLEPADIAAALAYPEVPEGYSVYHRDHAGIPDAHPEGPWFFQPDDYDGGHPYSPGYRTHKEAVWATWDDVIRLEAEGD